MEDQITPNSTSEVEDQNVNVTTDTPNNIQEDGAETPGSRTAEARIQELLARNERLKGELESTRQRMSVPPPPQPTINDPQVAQAQEVLRQMGVVFKDELSSRDSVMQERMTLNSEHSKLEGRYNGNDGRPKYDRREVEDYMRDHGIYGDPEAAYKLKNEVELLDWTLKQAQKKVVAKPGFIRPGIPSSNGDDRVITREKLEESTKTPAGREWYNRNRSKILDLMQKGQL